MIAIIKNRVSTVKNDSPRHFDRFLLILLKNQSTKSETPTIRASHSLLTTEITAFLLNFARLAFHAALTYFCGFCGHDFDVCTFDRQNSQTCKNQKQPKTIHKIHKNRLTPHG